jgi:small subunit ribosomal protein S3
MGQKVNPVGLRIGLNKDWSSRWFADKKDYSTFLMEDCNTREYLEKAIDKSALLSHIDIERKKTDKGYNVNVQIFAARPGIIIGEKGANIEGFRKKISRICNKANVKIDVIEVKNPSLDAKIMGEQIADQLEKRASFRIAQKKAIMQIRKAGAKGVKTRVSGRLGGAEIAREEGYKEGTMAINTLRTDIDYAVTEAHTTYGKLGIKIWISRGEKEFGKFEEETLKADAEINAPRANKSDRGERGGKRFPPKKDNSAPVNKEAKKGE